MVLFACVVGWRILYFTVLFVGRCCSINLGLCLCMFRFGLFWGVGGKT